MTIRTAKTVLTIALVLGLASQALASSPAEVINNFAFNAARVLGRNQSTYFFSPYSIISAVAMAYAGASGNTAQEMQDVLGLSADIHAGISDLMLGLSESGQVSSANRLWLCEGLDVNRDYQYNMLLSYGSRAIVLDIKDKPEESCKTINNWVNWMTKGRIPTLLDGLDPETKMILTNAVYLSAEWQRKFRPYMTSPAEFRDGARVSEVQMMRQEGRFQFAESDDVKVIRLPYAGQKLSMTVILPAEGKRLELDAESLKKWREMLAVEMVDLWLPKFRTEESYELADVFKALGVRQAFTNDADFSGISTKEKLKIDAVIHKTFIDVNEERTEAAAATAVRMVGATAMPPEEMKEFHADHPFMYFITDDVTGTIIFMGRQTF